MATLFDDDGITVSPDLDIWWISEGKGFLCTVGHAVCSSLHMECNSCSLPCSLRSLTRQATVTISRCRVPVFSEVLGVSPCPYHKRRPVQCLRPPFLDSAEKWLLRLLAPASSPVLSCLALLAGSDVTARPWQDCLTLHVACRQLGHQPCMLRIKLRRGRSEHHPVMQPAVLLHQQAQHCAVFCSALRYSAISRNLEPVGSTARSAPLPTPPVAACAVPLHEQPSLWGQHQGPRGCAEVHPDPVQV